jgi:AcrR family transcriptional regulator
MKKSNLTVQDWIKAGMKALSTKGASGLKVEVLARELKTTKGSFYWHFKDIGDFEQRIIAMWQQAGTTDIIALMNESEQIGPVKLHRLFAIIGETNAKNPYGGVRCEPAIREWSKSNKFVRKCVSVAGAQRMGYVADLLKQCGHSPALAASNAKILYAALIGFQTLAIQNKIDVGAEMQALVKILLRD